MGKINEYQRKQLASSVVGVAPQDTSGAIIGKSITTLGDALYKRQEALDTADATTAYYEYAAATSIGSAELMKKYQTDPSLDPLTFDSAYQSQAAQLATKFKENIPERIHNKFDLMVSKAQANQSIKNTTWAFAQQNRNALEGFYELGTVSVTAAGNSMNAEDYLDNRAKYTEASKNYRDVMTPASLNSANIKNLKSQAISYWNANIDYENQGDPGKFMTALEDNPELRAALKQDMGSAMFESEEKKLGKLTTQMGLDRANRMLIANNEELQDKVNKIYDPDNGYGLRDITNELEQALNNRDYMINTDTHGEWTAAIIQAEKNIKNLTILKRIAGNVNDMSTISDVATKAGLNAEIAVATLPYGSSKFKKKLIGIQTDVGKQLTEQDADNPWYSYLWGPTAFNNIRRHLKAKMAGVDTAILAESKENVVANQSRSEYIESMQTLNGKILQAVDDKMLTFKDGMDMMTKVGMVGTVDQYDSLTTEGPNWFTQGYAAFGEYAHSLNLDTGSVIGNRKYRDEIQNQMVDDLTKRVASRGKIPISPSTISSLIKEVQDNKSAQIYPELMGKIPGDYITLPDGKEAEFLGYSGGRAKFKVGGVQKAVDNL